MNKRSLSIALSVLSSVVSSAVVSRVSSATAPALVPALVLVVMLAPAAAVSPCTFAQADQSVEAGEQGQATDEETIARLRELIEQMDEEHRQEVAALAARIDALERLLTGIAAEDAPPGDELAAILAEAEALAAEEAEREERQEEARESHQGGQRNLQALNPEISVTGDFLGIWHSADEMQDQFLPREVEFSFQHALDPYSRMKVFLVVENEAASFRHEDHEEGGVGNGDHGDGEEHEDEEIGHAAHGVAVDLEEAYIEWVALPGGLSLKAGRFYQKLGTLNRWHLHSHATVDAPLVLRRFFGEHGLAQSGLSLAWAAGAGSYANELAAELTNAENEGVYAGEFFSDPAWLLHNKANFDLGPDGYFEVGLTGATGPNDAEGKYRSTIAGADVSWLWEPADRARYRSVEFHGEYYHSGRETMEHGDVSAAGWFAQAEVRLSPRWFTALRYDNSELPRPLELVGREWEEGLAERELSAALTFWQSEYVRIRLQYTRVDRDFTAFWGPEKDDVVTLQFTWAAGPHKHEKY